MPVAKAAVTYSKRRFESNLLVRAGSRTPPPFSSIGFCNYTLQSKREAAGMLLVGLAAGLLLRMFSSHR